MMLTRDRIVAEVLGLLNHVVQDWEFEAPLTEQTRMFADLALESLDIVILGSKIQEHFGQIFPFPALFAELGQRAVPDLSIGELVDFIERHQQPSAALTTAPVATEES